MDINKFLIEISEQGVKLWVEGDQLHIRAPKELLTLELTELLTRYKAEIVLLLKQSPIGSSPTSSIINGYHVEVNEVEAALLEHPAIHQVAVIVVEKERGHQLLEAYIVLNQDNTLFELESSEDLEKESIWAGIVHTASQQARQIPYFMDNYHNSIAREVLGSVATNWQSVIGLRVLEVGAGSAETSASLLPVLASLNTSYTYTDSSLTFINSAKEKFKDYPFVQYSLLDICENPILQGYEPHSFDVIIATNIMHKAHHNISISLQYLHSLLTPSGILLILETTQNNHLHMIEMSFIDKLSLSHCEDETLLANWLPLWIEEFHKILHLKGFEKFVSFPESMSGEQLLMHHVTIAQASSHIKRFKQSALRHYLQQKLPNYMIPSTYVLVDALPLTIHGKVDLKALSVSEKAKQKLEKAVVASRTPIEKQLVEIWLKDLGLSQIGIHDNFFEIGGDSLLATQLINRVAEIFKVYLPLSQLLEAPTIASLSQLIETIIQTKPVMEDVHHILLGGREEGEL